MIIKIIGMCVVFISSGLIGLSFAECLASREKELLNIGNAVDIMSGELSYSASSVKDIILKITPRVRGEAKKMFETMSFYIEKDEPSSKAWEKSIMKNAPRMSLTKADAEFLSSLGFLLNAYEAEEQKNHFIELREKINTLAGEAGESKQKNSKMLKMLGFYGGALLCVIMF